MKKLLFILALVGIVSSCSDKKDSNFTLKGNVEGMRKGTVYLQKDINGQLITVDSLFLKGTDAFEFNGNIETPEVFFLSTSRKNSAVLPIFIEKKVVTIKSEVKDLLSATIEGSENQILLDQFNKIISKFNTRKNELYIKSLQANTNKQFEVLEALSDKYNKNEIKKIRYILNFAIVNASKDVSPYIALNYLSSSDITVLDTINKSIPVEIKTGKYGFELNEFVTQIKATSVGNKFPEIIQQDSTNNNVTLENKKGYMLVNFWASYNQNSRTSNILFRNISEKFNSDEIKIISISLDNNKNNWLEAIKKDNLPWSQLTDLKGIKNAGVRKLAIRAIPENILIDNNGIIIGRNLTTKDIVKLTEKYIKNNKIGKSK